MTWENTLPLAVAISTVVCGKLVAGLSEPPAVTGTTPTGFRPDRLITFSWHAGDVPRGIIADIIDDLGITRDEFYFKRF